MPLKWFLDLKFLNNNISNDFIRKKKEKSYVIWTPLVQTSTPKIPSRHFFQIYERLKDHLKSWNSQFENTFDSEKKNQSSIRKITIEKVLPDKNRSQIEIDQTTQSQNTPKYLRMLWHCWWFVKRIISLSHVLF